MPSITSFTRHGLAVLAAVLLSWWVIPLPAAAESASIARVDRTGVPGEDIHLSTGDSAATTLFNLRVGDASAVGAYCVDVSTSVDHRAAYTESDWADLPAAAALGRVHWIVRNSYPALTLDRVSAASGVQGLRPEHAIAGTQAAIWHLTNGAELGPAGPDGPNSPQVRALYEYLLDNAAETAEPSPALAISPAEVVGDAPAPLGPLTVRTTSRAPVRLTVNGAEGAVLVDERGDPVVEARDGDEVLLALPAEAAEGTAAVYAHAEEATVQTGRVYTGKDGVQTQPLVAAEPAAASLTVSAKVNWNAPALPESADQAPPATPAPTARPDPPSGSTGPTAPVPSPPDSPVAIAEDKRAEPRLASTGARLVGTALAALALLTLGSAAILLVRRRRE